MDSQIKALAGAITHQKTSHLILSHTKELFFNGDHLVIFIDNTGPLHELSDKDTDEHLRKGIEDVYGDDITYELKHFKPDKGIGRENSPTYKGKN